VRWLEDECVTAELVEHLRAAGHDVAYVAELTPSMSDEQVIDRAWDENRLLLTEDKDFGELVFHRGRSVPGLVFLRIGSGRHQLKWSRLQAVIVGLGERLIGRHTVIDESRFRSRPLLTVIRRE
jgi:predicted nuclease of predicted toxin-antitoxin system